MNFLSCSLDRTGMSKLYDPFGGVIDRLNAGFNVRNASSDRLVFSWRRAMSYGLFIVITSKYAQFGMKGKSMA